MKSLLCAKVNSDRVWAQINAVMSGALCRRQKASFYNGLLCGLPTTCSGYFAQVWSFSFLKTRCYWKNLYTLLEGEVVLIDVPPAIAWGGGCVVLVVVVVAEADILNSWERRRIGFHDRVVQSWGDLQDVWWRLLRVSVFEFAWWREILLHCKDRIKVTDEIWHCWCSFISYL